MRLRSICLAVGGWWLLMGAAQWRSNRRETGALRDVREGVKCAVPLFSVLLLMPMATSDSDAAESAAAIHETFDAKFDAKRFLTPIPNKNTEIRDGVMWTHGSSGGKYPPMVYLGLDGKDLTISFRYRHLSPDGMLWLFVDGDDGYGSVDHMLRVKLLRDSIALEVDAHTKDPKHPLRQNTREADPVSGAFRTNELFSADKVDLSANIWREVKLVFSGESVKMSVDGQTWSHILQRPNFNATKRKLLWMQNGGAKGIEIDDVHVVPTFR